MRSASFRTTTTIEIDAELLFQILNAQQAKISASSLSGVVALDVVGTGDIRAVNIDGDGDACMTATTTDARVLTATNNSPGSSTLVVSNSDATGPALTVSSGETRLLGDSTSIGLNDTDALEINSTTTVNADVSAPTATITASVLNGSTVGATVVDFNTSVASSVDGRVSFDGRKLSLGAGGQATEIRSAVETYVVSDTTVAAAEDIAGATASLVIDDDEWVIIRVEAWQSSSVGTTDPSIILAASNGVDDVLILNAGDADEASKTLPTQVAANDDRPTVLSVRWKPTNDVVGPDNTSWTIRARHGISGGGGPTLTTTNLTLSVRYD